MSDPGALLAAVAADPASDLPRLVYADYLDDHGDPERAELIRVQCELEPVRDRYDLPHAVELHERESELLPEGLDPADEEWLTGLFGHAANYPYPPLVYHRGFVQQVRLPAPAWVDHGAAFRERFPLLRSLRVHRLNGWGKRLAECESLAGLTELDLACWYTIIDLAPLITCRHLKRIESVRLWFANHRLQVEAAIFFARLLPMIRSVQIVDLLNNGELRQLLNALPVGPRSPTLRVKPVIEDRSDWLFPFAADFSPEYYIGRLGDGRLFFGYVNDYFPEHGLRGLTFAPDGTPGDRLDLSLPPAVAGQRLWDTGPQAEISRMLGERVGFVSAAIRVKSFQFAEADRGPYPEWWRGEECEGFGEPDDPADWPPRNVMQFHGNGAEAAFRFDGQEFTFNDWWCDKTGQVHTT